MADYNAYWVDVLDYSDVPTSTVRPFDSSKNLFVGALTDDLYISKLGSSIQPFDNRAGAIQSTELPVARVSYYAMRGRDNTGYKTWVATGSPDTTGSQYTGQISGTMQDIVILQSWSS